MTILIIVVAWLLFSTVLVVALCVRSSQISRELEE